MSEKSEIIGQAWRLLAIISKNAQASGEKFKDEAVILLLDHQVAEFDEDGNLKPTDAGIRMYQELVAKHRGT